ncbi:CubicO group peptidase, beta-lactamase class C family [Mucilaginibacter lappiensis]|uniref:CubicO group peptidase (Beta-lactamase class C family) n=1 Tax=Mucilaginibacter lappiensis TaxID=354630 RepID=A0ABR6PEE8_9SPHI|nr:serine hydrolase [Mucilaginibacter lappiensis]MBB6108139.1 CubicO group peptidase (beta-lactamase class C family) [Mucilaginibacter lappiensis]SIQ50461.1 CubicO group peptidase, beta-lactamase class C family [Mucilaginibacter lappiensis]
MKRIALLLILSFIWNLSSFAQIQIDTISYIKNNPLIYSLVISKNNKIIHQQYFNRQDSTTLFNDQSLTKSVTALLIGIAIDKGYIKSVDEKVADFFPELKMDTDKRKQDITIRQVMNQASGFYHEGVNVGALLSIPDPSGYVIKAPMVSDPGKVFRYNNAATHLLSVIITKSTHMDTRSFAKKFLFDPLGITTFDWKKMNDGYYDGCGLLSIRLRSVDMLKLGNLVLNKGVYRKQQIVPAKWINSIINPEVTYKTPWGLDNSLYGLCWYHADYQGTKIIYALGWGGQFMFVIPSLKAVIMTNSGVADATAIKEAALITGRLFPELLKQLQN